jgi:anti-anti-sigma factor
MGMKTTVSCGTHLDIRQAEKLKERLLAALEKEAIHYTLIGSKVEKVDSAGLQLIVSFIRRVQAEGGKVIWQKPSDELVKASQLLGLTAAINL